MKSPNLFLKFVLLLTSGLCCYSFLSASTTINYTYDAAGRLIGADYGGRATISYAYDANGNLLKRQQVSGTAIRLPVNDFNNDGKSDVVLQRSNLVASGQAMDGRSNSSGNPVSLILGSGQVQLLGVADMDRNGTSDLIVRRLDGSNVHEVKLRNASGAVTLTRTYNPGGVDWRIVGLYDQNKDTHYDLIWQNSRTGQVVIWYLNASGARSSVVTFVTSMDDYRIVAVGDMNGDGHMDLLWQKVTGTTTQIVAWYLNAAGQRLPSGGTKVIGSVTGGYRCVGLGDYNSDGVLDILWQQADNQRIALWHMNTSGVRIGDAVVLPVGGIGQYVAHWQWEFEMQSVHSDINGDGVADIALQRSRDLVAVGQAMNGSGGKMGNTINLIAFGARVQVVGVASMNQDNTGDLIVRRLDGSNIHEVRLRNASGAVTATRTYNPGGADWRLVGVYDQNKDGNRDLVWQNMATGQVIIWYLNASGVRTSFATLVASMADYRIVAVGDMNGDGHMDLLWQKVTGTTTQIVAWYLNAAGQRLSSGGTKVLGTVTGGYRCVGLGDYNSDGVLDILWQQVDTQQIVLWHMNTAGVRIGNAVVLPVGGSGQYVAHWQWEFSAGAVHNDENGDGRADILWQNSSTGQVVSWRMNGAWGRSSFATLASSAGSTERVVAQADFNGDGINDLLWSVKSGGQTRAIVWYRNAAGARTSYAVLGSVPEVYELVGAGDMNRDGNTDLLWQHGTTGQVVAWHYNGAGVRLSHAVLVASMSGFRVHAVGDMNGDGNADLIWQGVSGSNATTIIWYMNGAGARSSFRTLTSLPSAWTMGTVGDYNGDGHMDVIWKNTSTGQIVGWALNATQQRTGTHTIATGMAAWRAR